jgi:hypothetical protein
MGGGLMQLVAYGAQDIYLSGNPQITFFKVVYRRHTNFAVESIEQTFNGSAAAGSKISVTVSRNGDLLSQVWLVNNGSKGGVMTSERAFGQIDNVEVEIGGQVIDKQYGHWMQVWTDLSNPTDKTALLDSCAKTTTSTGENSYVPLQFWFCRNPGLALPLIALQYHEVKLNVTFSTAAHQLGTVSVWCDYVFLDTDERRRFAQVSHEYLIEQVQYSNALSVDSGADTATQHELRFNHPVKELVWTVHGGDAESLTGTVASRTDKDHTVTSALLQLNGHDRFKRRNGKYFTTVQRYQHHSGSSNANRQHKTAASQNLQIKAIANAATGSDFVINKLNGSPVTESPFKDPTIITYNEITNLAVKFGEVGLSDDDQVIALNSGPNSFRLYKLSGGSADALAGKTPAGFTANANIDADSVLVADSSDHILANSADISIPHVYSFALKPEEHQPSGTCNFSRIDNAVLNLKHGDVGANGTLKVYAVNYNVLRIMSGMGGLAYSN